MPTQIKVTLRFADHEECQRTAGYMGCCPHALACGMDDQGNLTLHFSLPEEKIGWALALAAEPSFVGASEGAAEVLVGAPDRSAELDLSPKSEPPCGAKCPTCPHYLKRCGGCPVTPLYRAGHKWE
jgi:hypothetical protein